MEIAASSSSSAPPLLPDPGHRVPADTVFFSIYPDKASSSSSGDDTTTSGGGGGDPLFPLQLHILDTVLPHFLRDYIWQHEPFNLSPSSGHACLLCGTPPGTAHLHGRVRYGDNVEDEWFVVFLLYEISKRVPSVSIRVWDSDGEFLLIEAAFSLPRWVNPENSENRVFIRRGELHILPRKHFPSNPTLLEALGVLESGKTETRAPKMVQEAINKRISGFPQRARMNMHRVRVRVPLPVAQVLKHEPCLIALAVEGFYDRDVDSMKYASKMDRFLTSEGGGVDIVQTSVLMSRAMYGQLVQQNFVAPRCYPMPSRDQGPVLHGEAELGMKIACGFEMMYQERRRAGEEGKCSSVDAFKKALESHGYFDGLLPGSKEYRRRMDEALERHKNSVVFSQTRDTLCAPVRRIEEILSLPFCSSDFIGVDLPPSDDDSWLYDGEEELKSAILERQKEIELYELKRRGKQKSGDHKLSDNISTLSDFNMDDMAKSMQVFMHKISSFKGAEVPQNRGEVDLDVHQFIKDMESVLGPVGLEGISTGGELDEGEISSSDMDFDESEDESNSAMESDIEDSEGTFMQSYSDALNEELKATTLKNSFIRAQQQLSDNRGEGSSSKAEDMDEELAPVDVDVNLVKSFIDSYSSQQGLPGPASNLLGLMGLRMPQDERMPQDDRKDARHQT